jgi:hypothetical protein
MRPPRRITTALEAGANFVGGVFCTDLGCNTRGRHDRPFEESGAGTMEDKKTLDYAFR